MFNPKRLVLALLAWAISYAIYTQGSGSPLMGIAALAGYLVSFVYLARFLAGK